MLLLLSPPPKIPGIKFGKIKLEGTQLKRVPLGSIVWKQGLFWKILSPPYKENKMISFLAGKYTPEGIWRYGKGTPKDTIQVIPQGYKVAKRIDVDLGWGDIHVFPDREEIIFRTGGMKTDIGSRLPGNTVGITVRDVSSRIINARM